LVEEAEDKKKFTRIMDEKKILLNYEDHEELATTKTTKNLRWYEDYSTGA